MANNGISKIEKWLKSRGYYMIHAKTEMYRYCGGFHDGEIYFIDIYRTSLGYYIKIKPHGRPRYYLCETFEDLRPVSAKGIGFSQTQFINQIDKYFPQKEGPLE